MKRNDTLVHGRCGSYDRGIDEMELAGLTPVPSEVVKPPRVAESVVQLECKLRGTHEVKNAAGHVTGLIVIGEVNSPEPGTHAGAELLRSSSPVLWSLLCSGNALRGIWSWG